MLLTPSHRSLRSCFSSQGLCDAIMEAEEDEVQSVDVDWEKSVPIADLGKIIEVVAPKT